MKPVEKKQILNFRRFEFKYLAPTKLVDSIIASFSKNVVLDPYANKDGFYYVNSIYLDSDDFFCYQQKLDGTKNRKKYRLRYYGERPIPTNDPLFFEIKRKVDSIILKDRVVVKKNDLKNLSVASWKHIAKSNKKFFDEFFYDYNILRLKPRIFIQYKRRPYFSRYDKNFRVTFDYDIQAAKTRNFFPDKLFKSNIINRLTVVEVKFNGLMPGWFSTIIRSNNMRRLSFSKYCNSLNIVYKLNDEMPVFYNFDL